MARVLPRLVLHDANNAANPPTIKVRVECVVGLLPDEEKQLQNWRIDCVVFEEEPGDDHVVHHFCPPKPIPASTSNDPCPRVIFEVTLPQERLRSPGYEFAAYELFAKVKLWNTCNGTTVVRDSANVLWPLHYNQPPLPGPAKNGANLCPVT